MRKLTAKFESPDMSPIKFKCNDVIFTDPQLGKFKVIDGDFTHMLTICDKSTLIVRERFIYKLAKLLRLL